MAIFSRIGLFPTPPVQRPRDLAYASMERPPSGTLAVLAGQPGRTAPALVADVLAAAQSRGLRGQDTPNLISAAISGVGGGTGLQAIGGKTGAGTMLVHIPDPLIVALSGMVCAQYGLGGMVIVCIVNGITAFASSFIVPRLRAVLPPTVAGVVVCVGGLSLVQPALTHTLGMQGTQVAPADALLGGVTLLVIMAMSIWGSRTLKLFALLAGIVAGVALAAVMGKLHGGEALVHTPVFGLPSLHAPRFDVPLGVLVSAALLSIMVQLDTFACVVLMQKMDDAGWRRANMNMVSGGIRANALGNLLASGLGAYPNAVSSANLALCHISR